MFNLQYGLKNFQILLKTNFGFNGLKRSEGKKGYEDTDLTQIVKYIETGAGLFRIW
jgi:hypothetical protein